MLRVTTMVRVTLKIKYKNIMMQHLHSNFPGSLLSLTRRPPGPACDLGLQRLRVNLPVVAWVRRDGDSVRIMGLVLCMYNYIPNKEPGSASPLPPPPLPGLSLSVQHTANTHSCTALHKEHRDRLQGRDSIGMEKCCLPPISICSPLWQRARLIRRWSHPDSP